MIINEEFKKRVGRRFSMIRILSIALVVVLASTLAPGIGECKNEKAPIAASNPTSKPEGELIVVVASLTNQGLDPVLDSNASKWRLIPIFDSLIGLREETELSTETGVANKWEYSPDYKKLSLWLRKGIKFHNGEDLTAEDVKFSLERVVSPYSMDEYKEHIKNIKEIRILNPYRMELILEKPAPKLTYFLTTLQGQCAYIFPKNYIKRHGDKYFSQHPIGSGPYKFHSQMVDNFIKLEAINYAHWRVGVPKYKYLTFKVVPEESTRVAMLKRGEADIIDTGRARVAELEAAGFKVHRKAGGRTLGYQLQDQWRKDSPIHNKNVRQALALAVNKDEIIKYIMLGRGTITGIWPSGSYSMGYSKAAPLCPPYPYDPNRAKALLAEAGYPGGFALNFYSFPYAGLPESTRLVEALASNFEAIGIKVNIIPIDWGKLKEKIFSHDVPTSIRGQSLPNRLLGEDLPTQFYNSNGMFQDVRDTAMDAKLEACMTALGQEQYEKTIVDLFTYIHDEYINIPICELEDLFGCSDKITKWNIGKSAFGMNLESLYRR